MVTSGNTIRSDLSDLALSMARKMRATLPSQSPFVVLICPIVTRIHKDSNTMSTGVRVERRASSRVQLRIVERCKRGNQRGFETHRTREQVARQHAPRSLFASHIARAGNFIDHQSEFLLSFDDALHDRRRHSD